MTRQRFVCRRNSDVIAFRWQDIDCRVQFSALHGRAIGEIFLDGAKVGSSAQILMHDAAVCASLLLQHGCKIDDLRHSLLKLADGRSASPLGMALDLVAESTNA